MQFVFEATLGKDPSLYLLQIHVRIFFIKNIYFTNYTSTFHRSLWYTFKKLASYSLSFQYFWDDTTRLDSICQHLVYIYIYIFFRQSKIQYKRGFIRMWIHNIPIQKCIYTSQSHFWFTFEMLAKQNIKKRSTLLKQLYPFPHGILAIRMTITRICKAVLILSIWPKVYIYIYYLSDFAILSKNTHSWFSKVYQKLDECDPLYRWIFWYTFQKDCLSRFDFHINFG